MHADPARDWTVDDLGREVGASRSVLAQRFTDLVGEAPMRYLANWRMQLAKQMMRDGARNIQEVAARVGLRLQGRLQSRVQARNWLASRDVAQGRAERLTWSSDRSQRRIIGHANPGMLFRSAGPRTATRNRAARHGGSARG